MEKLDLDRGVWAPVGNMLVRRSTLGVAVLGDKLYAVGGFDGTNGLETVERFEPCKLIMSTVVYVRTSVFWHSTIVDCVGYNALVALDLMNLSLKHFVYKAFNRVWQ